MEEHDYEKGYARLHLALTILGVAVHDLLLVYDNYSWLNDKVDISNIIPMSLDEWHLEINSKIDEVNQMH